MRKEPCGKVPLLRKLGKDNKVNANEVPFKDRHPHKAKGAERLYPKGTRQGIVHLGVALRSPQTPSVERNCLSYHYCIGGGNW